MRIRKEIKLHEAVIERLQFLADKKNLSLKKYMEVVLLKESEKAIKQMMA